jgi:hypothetical protein
MIGRTRRIAALILLIAAFAYAKVKTQAAPDARFQEYKTYQWLPPRILTKTGLVENDDRVAPVIRRAVDQQMEKLGFTKVADGGDLQVSTLAFRESVPQLEAIIYPGGLDWGLGMPITTVGRYNHEGTLVVNLIDTKTKKSAWAGLSTGTFDKPEQLESKVNKAASDIFKKYPKPKR